MQKKKAFRLAGFAGALCASAALVSLSVSGTGAYFTDSHTGSINASTGQIKVNVSPQDGQLNFTNLLPGDYQTKTINYTAHPRGGTEDVWMVLPNYGQSGDAFTSHPESGATPLGSYGHFQVASTGGAHFNSYNLALSPSGQNSSDSCGINGNGWGGSGAQPNYFNGDTVPFCAPAQAILLQSGMDNGAAGHVNLTFGFTPKLGKDSPDGKASQNLSSSPVEQYEIVATQHGVSPINNG